MMGSLRIKVPKSPLGINSCFCFAGNSSLELHSKGAKIIWDLLEPESGWPCLLPCRAVTAEPYAAGGTRGTWFREESPAGLGTVCGSSLWVNRWTKSIRSRDPDHTNLLLASGSHGHHHLACLEEAHQAAMWVTYVCARLWLIFCSACSCQHKDLCSRVLPCLGLL